MDFIRSVSAELIAGLIGTLLGFLAKNGLDAIIKLRRDRVVLRFLGLSNGETVIVHSAIFDKDRDGYNYPSCDQVAARYIANLLESIGMKEGSDFSIEPEPSFLTPEGSVDTAVLSRNLILLGGPKRNRLADDILGASAKLRYDMRLHTSGENELYDRRTRHFLQASRDAREYQPADDKPTTAVAHDYGLIVSMPNPLHLDRGVVIIAGLHGPGTVGAAQFVSHQDHLKELNRRRKGGVIQEVVYVEHKTGSDEILQVSLI